MIYKKNIKPTNCLHCKSDQIQKNGLLAEGGQRWKCTLCHKQFSTGGIRGTYGDNFREKIVDRYCHKNHTARELSSKFGLSTSTIVSWGKNHKPGCNKCR